MYLFQSHGHVESEIAKWQKEIDQTEQQWLKKLQRVGSVDLATTAAGKLQENGSAESANKEKLQQNGSLQSATTEKFQYSGSAESVTTEKLQKNGSLQSVTTEKLQKNGSLQSVTTEKLQKNGSLQSATTEKLQKNGSLQSATTEKLQKNGSLQSATTGKLQQNGSLQSKTTGKLQKNGSLQSATTEKLQQNGSLQSTTTGKLQQNGSLQSTTTGKLQQNGSLQSTTTGKPPPAKHRISQHFSDVHDGGSCEQEGQKFKKNAQAAKSKVIDGGEWSNSGYVTPSECSTVSSDLDFDTDMPAVLPSVKELAKHFTGSTSDSDSSVTKVSRLGLMKSVFSFSSPSSSASSILFSLSTIDQVTL